MSKTGFLIIAFLFILIFSHYESLFAQSPSEEGNDNLSNTSTTKDVLVSKLSLNFTTNPDAVNVGQKFDIYIFLRNSGPTEQKIDSINLIPPWVITRTTQERQEINSFNGTIVGNSDRLVIEPNTTEVISRKVTVPPDTLGGEYNIAVLMSSSLPDQVISTTISTMKFDSLPLTGNIPFSILFLVIAGAITYFVFNVVGHRTVKGNYVEWVLSTTSIGFVIWYVLYYLIPSSSISSLEILSDNVSSVIILLGSALVIGFVSGLIKRYVVDKLLQVYRENKETRTHRLNLLRQGYTELPPQQVLELVTKEQAILINRRLGQGYALKVAVTTYENNTPKLIRGMLKRVSAENGIELSPKYIFYMRQNDNENAQNNFNAIKDILTSPYKYSSLNEPSSLSPLAIEMKEDKLYLTHVIKYLEQNNILIQNPFYLLKNDSYYNSISNEVRTILTRNIANQAEFLKILDGIDFSRLVKYVANNYDRRNKKPRTFYKEIFINKDLVKLVEFINYETRISLCLVEQRLILPGASKIKDINYMYDRT
ncbi:MAG: hypothetical protein E6L04_06345 [Thaumarchaeota archaeon]|nr:MAG: hypothetical protein E6L04_06345 [Nitrososphaerota archaeon]TLX86606.1 MAG: hypothetical protein E6K97_10890 [Nitrososphaerota archaeon]